MVRSYWKGTLVIALIFCGLAWGQQRYVPVPVSPYSGQPTLVPASSTPETIRPVPMAGVPQAAPMAVNQTDRIMTVTEPGKPPQQCRVVREWLMPDGNNAMEVQAVDSGEKMTIVQGGSISEAPDSYPTTRIQGRLSRIFRSGQGQMAPMGMPMEQLIGPGMSQSEVASSSGPDSSNMSGMTLQPRAAGTAAPTGVAAQPYRPGLRGPFSYDEYLASLRAKYGGAGAPAPSGTMMPGESGAVMANNVGAGTMLLGPRKSSVMVADNAGMKPDVKAATKLPEGSLADSKAGESDPAQQPWYRRWFGTGATKDEASGKFDREKYLAEMRGKTGKDQVAKKDDKLPDPAKLADANKPAAKTPTVNSPKPPPTTTAAAKPATETAQPSDWRKSWGKTASDQAKTDDKSKDKKSEETAKAKPEPKKELPAAPLRPDPLLEPDRYTLKPEIKPDPPKAPAAVVQSPLLSGPTEEKVKPEAKKPAPVVKVEAPGKASTQIPLGARSVLAAYDNQPGNVYYLPVPMVTVPPTAHMVRPPQPAGNLPPQVNDAMVNAFSGQVTPASYQQPSMAANAFMNGQPMMEPYPMAYTQPMMGMGPYGPMPQAMMMPGGPGMMPGGPGMMPPGMMPPAMMGVPGPVAAAMMGGQGMAPAAYSPPPMAAANACDPQAAQQLMQTLREALYPSQREWAAESLAGMDWRTHPQVFDALLMAAREDPAATVRTTCVRCLSGMGVNSQLLVMTLQSLKADSDPRVRSEVEQALAKMPQQTKTEAPVQPASAVESADPQ
jgi:hypothetical protein